MEFLWRVEELEATMDEYIYKSTNKEWQRLLGNKKDKDSSAYFTGGGR
jgi:hypothetical protein